MFPQASVLENLLAGAHAMDRRRPGDRLEQIFTYFPRLKERARQVSGSLGGGEQQMLAIGRALLSRPRLLLDEPSLGLAPVMVQRIGGLIREIQVEEKLSVILAEQNSAWALRLAAWGVVVETGTVRMAGPSRSLLADGYVQQAYLGA